MKRRAAAAAATPATQADPHPATRRAPRARTGARAHTVVRLPSYEQVQGRPGALRPRLAHLPPRIQPRQRPRPGAGARRTRDVWLNPPPMPLTTAEMDHVYGLPYARAPHPAYGEREDPGLGDDPLLGQHHARLLRRLHLLLHHRARRAHHPEPLGGIDPARDRGNPRQDARLHRRHLRPRRADRQHVPHGLQGPEDRVRLPPPVLRLSRTSARTWTPTTRR